MYINKNKGFTLAELVLAMAIVSILTAAMVPMLKYHKVRPREKFTPHGIIECYYDESGALTMFQKDNDKHPKGEEIHVSGNTCSFSVPKANYYELHVIDAGSAGGGSGEDYRGLIAESFLSASNSGPEKSKVELNADSSVSVGDSAADLPDFVKNIWKKLGSSANLNCPFNITTFVGDGNRQITIVKNPDIDPVTGRVVERDEKVWTKSGTSGQSATVSININYNTIINKANPQVDTPNTNTPILVVDGKTLVEAYGTRSSQGNVNCNGTTTSACGNAITLRGVGATLTNPKTLTSGSGNYKQNIDLGKIEFSYPLVDLQYAYGEVGKNGKYLVTYYEKIKATGIKLHPAKNSDDTTDVTLVHAKGGDTSLFKTKTKQPGEITHLSIPNITTDNLPVPVEFSEELIKPNINAYDKYRTFCSIEPEDKGMCRYITKKLEEDENNISVIPGLGGYGGYPLLYSPKGENGKDLDLTVTMKHSNSSQKTSLGGSVSYDVTDYGSECDYNNSSPILTNGNKVCKGTKGNSGAIILLW